MRSFNLICYVQKIHVTLIYYIYNYRTLLIYPYFLNITTVRTLRTHNSYLCHLTPVFFFPFSFFYLLRWTEYKIQWAQALK